MCSGMPSTRSKQITIIDILLSPQALNKVFNNPEVAVLCGYIEDPKKAKDWRKSPLY